MQRVLMMLANDYEDSEMRQPLDTLRSAGIEVVIAGPEAGKIYRGKRGRETVTSDVAIADMLPDSFDMLCLPGGYSPDHLRVVPHAVELVRHFHNAGKPIAAVCHGPQLLISADVVRGKQVTGYDSIVVDLNNAGAHYVNHPVVIDGNLITSRKPDDLPLFCQAMISALKGERIELVSFTDEAATS